MTVSLKQALEEFLGDWQGDLPPDWRLILRDTELAFDAVGSELELHPWEPIFPSRRGFVLPGEPSGAHLLRAFDDLPPDAVGCVVVGQDPYPDISFSTGRAFDVGKYQSWSGLNEMPSSSMRSLIQCIYALRSGQPHYADTSAAWPKTLQAIQDIANGFPATGELAQEWVSQGVLLLNASLTISRFSVRGDPHQIRGHLPLWRPVIARLIRYFAYDTEQPVVFLLCGEAAQQAAIASGIVESGNMDEHPLIVTSSHPAAGNDFLRLNPFSRCNEKLLALQGRPIQW